MRYYKAQSAAAWLAISLGIIGCGGSGSGGGGSDPVSSTDSGAATSGSSGSPTPSSGNSISPAPYIGTWKGTTYSYNGTFPNITLTLSADGSYSCSGYPQHTPEVIDTTWTPWRGICSTSSTSSATWDLPSENHLRLTHPNSNLPGIGIIRIISSTATSLVLELPQSGENPSKLFAQLEKVQ